MELPNLNPTKMELSIEYTNKLLGLTLSPNEISELLEKMRFGVEINDNNLIVSIPSYRTDILHPIDLVEDVAVAYGYENFIPKIPKIMTVGSTDKIENFCSNLRDQMIGLGFSELKTLVMTNKIVEFDKMNIDEIPVTEATKPISADLGIARTWLLPSLMVVLSKNKSREYPQMLFEIGDVIDGSGKNDVFLSGVIAHAKTNFSEIKGAVLAILESNKISLDTGPHDHPSFILGRCSKVKGGFFGEINPIVLQNFGLEVPVTAFEIKVNEIFNKNQ